MISCVRGTIRRIDAEGEQLLRDTLIGAVCLLIWRGLSYRADRWLTTIDHDVFRKRNGLGAVSRVPAPINEVSGVETT